MDTCTSFELPIRYVVTLRYVSDDLPNFAIQAVTEENGNVMNEDHIEDAGVTCSTGRYMT